MFCGITILIKTSLVQVSTFVHNRNKMNTDQIKTIKNYLKVETNYAVILNGKYGIGKTHFFKEVLTPEIRKIPTSENEQKNYIPIHISLFGYKSLEDIQSAIFLEIHSWLKTKGGRLASGITKTIARGIVRLNGLGNIDNYIEDINPKSQDLIDYNQLIICFDDLDRKHPSLELSEVFGFINSLVENQEAKIIIITNSDFLEKESNYAEIKEKVVGASIEYIPNPDKVFDQIIETRYKGEKEYLSFLIKHKELILQSIALNENNFRNLIYFLSHFRSIFSELDLSFQNNKNLSSSKNQKFEAVLIFALAVSIEFKLRT